MGEIFCFNIRQIDFTRGTQQPLSVMGMEVRKKSKRGSSARVEEPEGVLATDIVHAGEGEINTSYQTVCDITGDHANLFLVASKEIRTTRPQWMMAPSALWGTATLSIFRWRTTI